MRKHYIISYEYKSVDSKDYRNSFACSFDTPNGDELANEILEAVREHALTNTKYPLLPNTGIAVSYLLKLEDEQTSDKGEVDAS